MQWSRTCSDACDQTMLMKTKKFKIIKRDSDDQFTYLNGTPIDCEIQLGDTVSDHIRFYKVNAFMPTQGDDITLQTTKL